MERRKHRDRTGESQRFDAPSPPRARITRLDGPQSVMRRSFTRAGEEWLLDAGDLPPGIYRIAVQLPDPLSDGTRPEPVHDIFEIAGPADAGV